MKEEVEFELREVTGRCEVFENCYREKEATDMRRMQDALNQEKMKVKTAIGGEAAALLENRSLWEVNASNERLWAEERRDWKKRTALLAAEWRAEKVKMAEAAGVAARAYGCVAVNDAAEAGPGTSRKLAAVCATPFGVPKRLCMDSEAVAATVEAESEAVAVVKEEARKERNALLDQLDDLRDELGELELFFSRRDLGAHTEWRAVQEAKRKKRGKKKKAEYESWI